MASIVLSLIEPVIELGKCIYDPLKRHCGFLLCYKKKLHVLRKEVNSLCTERDDIKRKLEDMRTDRQSPLKKVEEWKNNVDMLVREVEELEMQLKEESTCINGWCPNLSWRYHLGKSAATKVDEVKELKKECEGFGDSLTHLPRQPSIELIRGDPMQQNEVAMTIMNDVMQALRDDNIRSIGIHGMGGIGKTTLVDNINNKLEGTQLFDKVIKVTVSQIVNEKAIQDTIAERLGLDLIRENTINGRANNLVERLKKHQRVLIILDDVWSKLDIIVIGIPSEDEHKNCKIIVTTRNQDVCRQMGLQKVFAMKPLSYTDSWALFAHKIGDVVSKNLSIAKSIVKECKGSPLAIVTIGSTLRQEDNKSMWEDTLRRLKSSEPIELEGIIPQVITSIKLSYDYIKDEEMKLCFLFCCLFPEDCNIGLSELRRYGIGEGFLKVDGNLLQSQVKLEAYIKKLKACNLLLDSETEGYVKMHDVVRDIALWIGRKNGQGFVVKIGVGSTDWPPLKEENNVQRISLMQNKIRRLSILPKLPQLRTLLFEVSPFKSHLEHIEDVFFEGMKALVNLDLGDTRLSRLPSSISCLTNLRTLVLKNHGEKLDVAIIGELKRLEILELSKGCNFPIKFVQLTNLRVLHMDIPLGSIPANVISKLVHLEELHLSLNYGSKKKDDESEHCSLVEVTSLECLTSLKVAVDEVQLLSQVVPFHLNQLRAFHIFITEKIYEERYFGYDKLLVLERLLPQVQDWVKNLLKITESLILMSHEGEISGLMGSMASLKGLELLHSKSMEHLVNTRDFPLAVDAFGRLEKLILEKLSSLEKISEGPLPYGFGMNLRELKVVHCKKLTTLLPFDVLRAMHSLMYLSIEKCESMTHIVSTAEAPSSTLEKALENLYDLKLNEMPNLIGICNGSIPSRFIGNLKQLDIMRCKKLKGVFPWGLALETVEEVYIATITGGEVFCDLSSHLIPPNALGKLERLHLHKTKQMKKVFHESCPTHPLDSIDGRVLYNLRYMELMGLPNLRCLFSFGIALLFLPNLSLLHITDCEKLETVIIAKENENEIVLATQRSLPMLNRIQLSNLPKLTGLYSGSGVLHLPSLETIEVCNCIKLMQLSLEPDSCPKLRQIEGGKKWFQALEQEMQEEIVRSRFQALFVVDPDIENFESELERGEKEKVVGIRRQRERENEDQDEGDNSETIQVENESYTQKRKRRRLGES